MGSAQQVSQYTQYLFDHFNLNPAVAGSKECIDVHMGYRSQWVGFEGAPRSIYASANGRLPQKGKNILRTIHGIGGKVESDQTGPIGYTGAYLSYAFHVPLTLRIYGAAGLHAGIKQYTLDASKVTLTDFGDPAIQGSKVLYVAPDITPGIWVYSDDFYVGFSIRQVIANKLNGIGNDSRLRHHYALVGGKQFEVKGEPITYTPSALIKFAPLSSPAIDVNILGEYKERLALGLSYRNIDAVAALVRVNFLKYFSVGYSFDFTTSKIRLGSANTHEVTLGIYACPQYGKSQTKCPAYY